MKTLVLVAAVLAVLPALSADSAAVESAPAPAGFIEKLRAGREQTIVYYGTSLTAGGSWTRFLTDELKAKFPGQIAAHNKGGPGMHSGWGVRSVDERVIAYKPDVVFIEFSVNDAVARFKLSPEKAKENLDQMIDRIRAARPECEIILQVMNPIIDKPESDSGWRPNLNVYQDNYREVAAARGLLLVDHMPAWMRLLETDEKKFREYVPDGVHPKDTGYQYVVMPELRKKLGLL